MRFLRSKNADDTEAGDMTPMIDMVFLLIAFFTVLINFSEADQNQRIKLPTSEMAIPPETPPESIITLQITQDGPVLISTFEFDTLEQLERQLKREKDFTMALEGADFRKTQIVVRADGSCETEQVLRVIGVCQDLGYERFSLRAKQQQSASFTVK